MTGDESEAGIRELIGFEERDRDFVVSVPHAGLYVPARFSDHFDLKKDLMIEVDAHSDKLVTQLGGMHINCNLAPFFVDMNRKREGSDDPLVPIHLRNDPATYRRINQKHALVKPYSPEQKAQVLEYYDLYYYLLKASLQRMKADRGYALLIDAHSMTSSGLSGLIDPGQERKDFVVGTLYGESCHPEVVEVFRDELKAGAGKQGLGIGMNEPYAGGFITMMHSDPDSDVHVIQIEVSMNTYMHEGTHPDPALRYQLKPEGLEAVRGILATAVDAASRACKTAYI